LSGNIEAITQGTAKAVPYLLEQLAALFLPKTINFVYFFAKVFAFFPYAWYTVCALLKDGALSHKFGA
jgi:hypothetical protein